MTHSILSLCAEPASIIYIITGAVGAAFAKRRSSKETSKNLSTFMGFCSRESREMIKSVDVV
jgi:hypothetical protein